MYILLGNCRCLKSWCWNDANDVKSISTRDEWKTRLLTRHAQVEDQVLIRKVSRRLLYVVVWTHHRLFWNETLADLGDRIWAYCRCVERP